jgi:hypothetical protein
LAVDVLLLCYSLYPIFVYKEKHQTMLKFNLYCGLALLCFLSACKKQITGPEAPVPPPTDNPRSLGFIPVDPATYQSMIRHDLLEQDDANARTTNCTSVDLSSMFPAPADQGFQGSCVSFAVGYYMKSYWEGIENSWALTTANHITSPQYIFSQTWVMDQNGDVGSFFHDALNLINAQGAATLDQCPYDPWNSTGYLTGPTDAMRRQAFRFRNNSWSALPTGDVAAIKTRVCNNEPVAIGFPVHPDFDALDASNDTYDDMSGNARGRHAVCIIGYDDAKGAFRFINSWSQWWGVGGYGWIDYDLVDNNNFEAYVMFDGTNPRLAEEWSSTSSAGLGSLGYYSGDVNGDGNSDVIQPWNNNGTLAIIAHDITPTPTSFLINQTMWGNGSTSLGFIPADANGDGKTDLVQAWKNGTKLALTLFTSNGSSFTQTWNTTTGSGYQSIALLPVDYDGDGKTDIAHLWNNGGNVGIIIYRSNGSSYSQAASTTVASGTSNMGFIPADYDGDGKTDIIQTWDNSGSVGLAVFRSSGSNYSVAWSGVMSQGSPNVGFTPVDYDGDGKTDLVQGWNNGNKLNFIVYRSSGSAYSYLTNVATRQGYWNMGLLPQKRAGAARTGVTQVYNNSNYTAFIRYDGITY